MPVPENREDEFIDSHIKEVEEKENDKKKLPEIAVEGFTVLGGKSFNKKEKVQ